MIPNEYIDEVLQRVDLVELIGETVQLKRSGKEYKALCPFHNERTPSFMVSPQKQLYYCHGCGASGNAAQWMEKYNGQPFPEAIRMLGQRVGLPPPPSRQEDVARLEQLKPLKEALTKVHSFYRSELMKAPRVLEYLASRGVSRAHAEMYELGYAPARYQVEGVRGSEAYAAGIATKDDEGRYRWLLRDRLIFPIRNSSGTVIGFGGRQLGGSGPKYLNSSESPLYVKANQLYGVGDIAASAPVVCVHEGYMDSLVCNIHGFPSNAVCGSAMSQAQADTLLARHSTIVLMFDPDAAGLKATLSALEVLMPKAKPRHTIRIAQLPEGIDPDEFVLAAGDEAMQKLRDDAPMAGEWVLGRMENMGIDDSAKYLDWIKKLAASLTGSYAEAFVAEMQRRGLKADEYKPRSVRATRPIYHGLSLPMKMTAVILDRPDFARTSAFSTKLMPEPVKTLARVIRQRPEANAASILSMLTPEWQKGIAPAVEAQLPDLSDVDVQALYLETALEEAKRLYQAQPTDEGMKLCEVLEDRLDALDDPEAVDTLMPDAEEDEPVRIEHALSDEEEEPIPMD